MLTDLPQNRSAVKKLNVIMSPKQIPIFIYIRWYHLHMWKNFRHQGIDNVSFFTRSPLD